MKVSVIVPTYNQEALIARALQGILRQRRDFDIEIIVGDDASTDGTGEVVKALAEEHPEVVYVRQPFNRGLQNNYFDCIEKASGQYLADCGGDDEWTDPDKLRRQVQMLDANPDMALVHTGWQYRDEGTGEVYPSEPHTSQWPELKSRCEAGELFIPLLTRKPTPLLHLCTAVWRRDWFMEEYSADRDLFRNSAFGIEDVQIEVCMSRRGAIGYIPDVMMAYSVGKQSISSIEANEKSWRYIFGTLLLLRQLATKYDIPHKVMRQTYTERLDMLFGLSMHMDSDELMRKTHKLASELQIRLKPKWQAMVSTRRMPGASATYRGLRKFVNKLKRH